MPASAAAATARLAPTAGLRPYNTRPFAAFRPETPLNREWSIERARHTYSIPHWSEGYVDVGADGRLLHCKVQDASMLNWFGLAIAVRDNEISDFPICNKSFDLSYCGNDL